MRFSRAAAATTTTTTTVAAAAAAFFLSVAAVANKQTLNTKMFVAYFAQNEKNDHFERNGKNFFAKKSPKTFFLHLFLGILSELFLIAKRIFRNLHSDGLEMSGSCRSMLTLWAGSATLSQIIESC